MHKSYMSCLRSEASNKEFVAMFSQDELSKLARIIAETREEEIGCDDCLEEMARFAEMKLAGLNAAASLPLVEDHWSKCGDCREEFEALLEALRAAEGSEPARSVWARLRHLFGSG